MPNLTRPPPPPVPPALTCASVCRSITGLYPTVAEPVPSTTSASLFFKAVRAENGCPVAVKVLPQQYGNLCKAEHVVALSGVEHPNLGSWIASHALPDLHKVAVVRDFYPRCVADLPLPLEPHAAARHACGILAGLHAVHRGLGRCHFAVVPSNFMLSHHGTAVLVDHTVHGVVGPDGACHPALLVANRRGWVQYQAPEVVLGQYTQASDMWSFAVSLVYLLSGTHPVVQSDVMLLWDLAHDSALPVPTTLPCPLKQALTRCLSVDAGQRMAAADMLDTLQQLVEHWPPNPAVSMPLPLSDEENNSQSSKRLTRCHTAPNFSLERVRK
eukprot:gene5429-966_t